MRRCGTSRGFYGGKGGEVSANAFPGLITKDFDRQFSAPVYFLLFKQNAHVIGETGDTE